MATITISYEITDEMQVILLQNFNELAERNLSINVDGYPIPCNIEPKTDEENNLQFGKRVIKEIVFNTVKANALRTDRYRYNTEHEALEPITENISEDLLT